MTARLAPEDEELARKKADLDDLCRDLADSELELQTLRLDLAAFEARYLQIVVRRLAELDRLKAEIVEEQARRAPRSARAQTQARVARERAEESRKAVGDGAPELNSEPPPRVPASEALKKRYREAARALHPDLASDRNDHAARTAFMARVNQAYADGDLDGVEEALREWSRRPEAVSGDGVGADLVRTIRRIAQVRATLANIRREIEALQQSDLFALMAHVAAAEAEDRDPLGEMAEQLDKEIAEAREALEVVMSRQPRRNAARRKRG